MSIPPRESLTGGAKIGMVNISWPLAKLSASPEGLLLQAKLRKDLSFPAESVTRVEPSSVIPFFRVGVRIHHTVDEHPSKICFYQMGSPEKVFSYLRAAGFPADKLAD